LYHDAKLYYRVFIFSLQQMSQCFFTSNKTINASKVLAQVFCIIDLHTNAFRQLYFFRNGIDAIFSIENTDL